MNISENYIITTDGSSNIMLNQRIYKPIYEVQKDKDGKEVKVKVGKEKTDKFKTVGYYGRLENLFKSIVDKQIIESGMEDLGRVIEVLKDCKEHMKDVEIMRHSELYKVKQEERVSEINEESESDL